MKAPINIIITDDSLIFREGLRLLLKHNNISILGEANNGLELLNLLENLEPDIILLDLEMPVMNGNSTLKILNEKYSHIKVIMLTVFSSVCLQKEYLMRGAKGYIDKSQSCEELIPCIKQINSHGFYNNNPTTEYAFTKRELEIIPLVCENKTNQQIATVLNISEKTVEIHRKNICRKTKTRNGNEFIKHAITEGLQFL